MHNRGLLKYKLHHVFFWLLVGGLWFFFRHQDYRTDEMAMKVTALKVADLALMIYLTNYLLIPKLLYKKHYVFFGLCFVLLILASSIGKMYLIGQIMERPDLFDLSKNLKARVYDNILPHFFIVIAGAAFKLKCSNASQKWLKKKPKQSLTFLNHRSIRIFYSTR
jgi:two-component system LytT family sensor kinase